MLSRLCRGAWIAFWSSLAFRASWSSWSGRARWTRRSWWTSWPGHSGRTLLPSGTLRTRLAFRTGWTGWSFKAACERQAGCERNCCHDTHKSSPPPMICLRSSRFGGQVKLKLGQSKNQIRTASPAALRSSASLSLRPMAEGQQLSLSANSTPETAQPCLWHQLHAENPDRIRDK